MSSKKAKKNTKPPELKVVFDTNVLWTGSASDLLKHEVNELIKNNSSHPDLKISWYLPEIVRHERQYQMLKAGLELLPSIQKLERVLGHKLNITEQIIENRIQETVNRHIHEIGLELLQVNPAKVDWNKMMLNSAYRLPPFSSGEKEKGFRDALVAEGFLQLVSNSPVTPKVCRIALVTGDNILAEAIKAHTNDTKNVRVLLSLEDLKSLINTLVAEVSEEFVAVIQPSAQSYFFEVDNKDTLYYKENIRNKIREDYSDKLSEIPQGASTRENGIWRIHPPRFIKKQGQRVYWGTRIIVESESYKFVSATSYEYVPETKSVYSGLTLGAQVAPSYLAAQSVNPFVQSNPLYQSGAVLGSPLSASPSDPVFTPRVTRTKTLAAKGKTIFEITWSVAVTTSKKLSAPKIEKIEFIETLWEES